MTIIHVSYCEFYDVRSLSFSTWGCVICNVSFKLDALYSLFEIYALVSESKPLILILKAIIPTDPMDHHIHILLNALRSYVWTDPHLAVFNGRCFDIIIMYFSQNHHLVFLLLLVHSRLYFY